MKPLAEQGYIILAQNTENINYVHCAETLAKTIKFYHPDAKICLLTDEKVGPGFLFDFVHKFPHPVSEHAWANDWQVFEATPYRETIKLEADMILASEFDHWWTMFEHRDVVISQGCRDYHDQPSTNRYYRKFIDQNLLPDVYNAITYWRLSKTAQQFFDLVRQIFQNWTEFRRLVKFSEDTPSTDFVYAMAAEIIGRERVTLPFATYPRIVHMKQRHIGTQTEQWAQELVWEQSDKGLRINTVEQWGALHYGRGWNYL